MSYPPQLVLLYNMPDVQTPADVVLDKEEALKNIADEVQRARPPIFVLFLLVVLMLFAIAGTIILTIALPETLQLLFKSVTLNSILRAVVHIIALLVCLGQSTVLAHTVYLNIKELFIHMPPETHYAELIERGVICDGKVIGIRRISDTNLREITYLYDTPKTKTGKYITVLDADIRSGYQVKVLYSGFIAVLL